MSSSFRVFLFLALATYFTVTFTNAHKIEFEPDESSANVGINLRVAFPVFAKPVNVSCISGGFVLRGSSNHTWAVPIDVVETCVAIWGHSTASFVAYDPDTDLGHTLIYWFAKFDGFFHSYDNVNWVKRASWN